MRTTTFLLATAALSLTATVHAEIVGNIEFGTEFTSVNGYQVFSSDAVRYANWGESGGGFHSGGVYLPDAYLLFGANVLMNIWGQNSALVTEGFNIRGLQRTQMADFPYTQVTLTEGQNGGAGKGPHTSSATVVVPNNTPWFMGFETEAGQRGFIEFEYRSDLEGLTGVYPLGWAIEIEPSDDPFYTFDVRNGIPSPTSAGLLGLAGIAATRRRR